MEPWSFYRILVADSHSSVLDPDPFSGLDPDPDSKGYLDEEGKKDPQK
jgi:hypothetical protein